MFPLLFGTDGGLVQARIFSFLDIPRCNQSPMLCAAAAPEAEASVRITCDYAHLVTTLCNMQQPAAAESGVKKRRGRSVLSSDRMELLFYFPAS